MATSLLGHSRPPQKKHTILKGFANPLRRARLGTRTLHCPIYKVNQNVSQNQSETLEEEPGKVEGGEGQCFCLTVELWVPWTFPSNWMALDGMEISGEERLRHLAPPWHSNRAKQISQPPLCADTKRNQAEHQHCLVKAGEDEGPSSSGNVSPFMVLINLTQHTHVLVQDSYSMCYTCLTGC